MKKPLASLLTLILLLVPAIALAKGPFDYISVKGPGIIGDIIITDPALTGFFSFADFSAGPIPAPADPGQGYQIVRAYVVEDKDQPFDQLEYYPYTGYVHYIGLAEGSSEYDNNWYAADPAADAPFRSALKKRAELNWFPLAALAVFLIVVFVAYRGKPASK